MSDKNDELNDFEMNDDGISSDTFEPTKESWDEDFSFNEELDENNLSIEDGFDEPTQSFNNKPEKSSLNWFNIGIVGFVIVCLGAGGYMFFGNKPQQLPQATQENNQALVNQAAISSEEQPQNPFETEGGLLANPEAVLTEDDKTIIEQKTAENDTSGVFDALDTPPQISENEMQDLFAAVNEVSNTPISAEPTAETQVITDNSSPTVAVPVENVEIETLPAVVTPTDPTILETETLANTETLPTTNVPVTSVTSEQDIVALNARIDELSNSLATVLNKLETMNVQNSQPSSAAPQNDQIKDIEATLNRLESHIDSLASAPKATQPARQAQKSSPKKTTSQKFTSNADKAAPIEKTQWDLRGASPEQAFLAERGTQNFRTVKVGDILKGVGTIQSITSENGKWVVKGSIGTVRQ